MTKPITIGVNVGKLGEFLAYQTKRSWPFAAIEVDRGIPPDMAIVRSRNATTVATLGAPNSILAWRDDRDPGDEDPAR